MSGIYIPGVELPPIDEYLHLRIDGNGYVSMQISENQYICDFYDTDKKAIELPPHGRLGDLDALLSTVRRICRSDGTFVGEFPFVTPYEIAEADTILPADPEKEDT